MLDNLQDFLPRSSSSIVFFRGAASLSSLSSELSGARLRQLYWRPGERFAADNRNRLQTFRVVPAAISTFLLLHRYILFPPRAFPPAATNNTSTRRRPRHDDNKVVGKAIVRLAIRPPRAFLVSEVARRLLYDRVERALLRRRRRRRLERRPSLGRRRDFAGICLPPLPSSSLQRSFIPGAFLYLRFLTLRRLVMHANVRA